MIALNDYFILSMFLFVIGLVGIVINRRSLIMILISLELILLAANINFIAFASFLWGGDSWGSACVMFILATAAAEAAIGLAIMVVYFKINSTTDVDGATSLRG